MRAAACRRQTATREGSLNRDTKGSLEVSDSAASDVDPFSAARKLGLEVFGYGVVSAIALAFDASLLKFLVAFEGWHYLPASTVSFIAGAAIAYGLSVRFVFRSRKSRNRVLEFGYFVALGIVGLVVNAVVISVAISLIGLGLLAAKLAAAGCTFVTNFALRRGLLFNVSKE